MVSNSDLEGIVIDSVQPSATYINYCNPQPNPTTVKKRFIDVLKNSESITNLLLNPRYREFVRSEDTNKFTEEEQIKYNDFKTLLKIFNGNHGHYHLLKDQGYPVLGPDINSTEGLVNEELFQVFQNYMIFRLENPEQIDLPNLLRLAHTFHEIHFPIPYTGQIFLFTSVALPPPRYQNHGSRNF